MIRVTLSNLRAIVEQAKATPGNIRVDSDYRREPGDVEDHIYRVSIDGGQTVIGFYGHKGTPLPLHFVPHNHPFRFLSTVLSGAIYHAFHAVEPGTTHDVYALDQQTLKFEPAGRTVKLVIVNYRQDRAGTTYEMPPETIHSALILEPTITVITRSHLQPVEFSYLRAGTPEEEVGRVLNWNTQGRGRRRTIPDDEAIAYARVEEALQFAGV